MRLSDTLTAQALTDLRRELRRSRDVFGAGASDRMRDRLLGRFTQIASGIALGHRHQLLDDTPDSVRCVTVGPLLIVYDAELRLVLAIVDGRRDIATLVGRRLDDL